MRSTCRLLTVAALVGALSTTAITATAAPTREQARAPRPSERAAIAKTSLHTLPRAERSRFRVTGVQVSTVSSFWAKSNVVPRPAYIRRYQGAYLVLMRPALDRKWIVVDLGTSGVGCRIAPFRVLNDLGIGGECAINEQL